jgi:hypothetical protein
MLLLHTWQNQLRLLREHAQKQGENHIRVWRLWMLATTAVKMEPRWMTAQQQEAGS